MLITYLRNIPLFRHLKEAPLKELASRCTNASFRQGGTVFRKTDMSTDLYIVKRGRLKAVLADDRGDEMVIAQFEPGDFFGELSLIDGKGRSATIVAEEDAELFVLSRGVFLDVLGKDPKIAIELMATLVERLRGADEMIESLAFFEVGERLLRQLLDGAVPAEGGGPDLLRADKLTHRELAARIGSSREAVSKCMKSLALKGIIREKGGQLLIASDALERLKGGGKPPQGGRS